VEPDDDEASLHERIKVEERELLVEVVRRLAAGPDGLAGVSPMLGTV
jgi:phosphoribosylglycinamide formyltransferase-1